MHVYGVCKTPIQRLQTVALIEIDGIEKTYPNGFCAVQSLSLAVEEGEFIALVGPSGCGKTTTLRMVAGLEEITGGQLKINGVVVNDVPPQKRDVAMVFQSYALYPHMTVFENMAFGLRLQKVPEAEIASRVQSAATSLGIADLLERRPVLMSGGQRQRVAMGRAIVRRPRVFLFDEPLSNLDARLRLQMRMELAKLHRQLGATSLYVTHDQVEAMTLADRIVLLKDGQVQQIGAPLELFERPANAFVAEFIGSPTMNLFTGELRSGQVSVDGVVICDDHQATGADGAVKIGVRPHDITLSDDPDTAIGPFSVEIVEPLGHETIMYCRRDGLELSVAASAERAAKVGDSVYLRPDPRRIHLFDGESGIRL